MAKGVPYAESNDIYDIAIGVEGTDHKPLEPKIAIFSALSKVLSLDDKKRQIELMGQEVYDYAKSVGLEYDGQNVSFFVDVFTEAVGTRYDKKSTPFGEWSESKQLKTVEMKLFGDSDRYSKDNYKQRLIAAKVRREYFSQTGAFS